MAQNHVEQGTKHLQGALKARKSIRKKYMCIAMIVVIVAVVLVLAFLLKK
jgi:t-SNARE complex subunit (syntaxin)